MLLISNISQDSSKSIKLGKELDSLTQSLFSIDKIINILKEKQLSGDYLFFQIMLPKIDGITNFDLIEGETLPCIKNTDYFMTYGALHEFAQLVNNINPKTFTYFCNSILTRKEMDIYTLAEIIAEREKLNIQEIVCFDFSHKEFFIEKKNKQNAYNKGSNIRNFTYCYNNCLIEMNLLDIFLIENPNPQHKLLIKLPSIMGISTLDILKTLSYIFKKVIVFKILQDSFFKDSFHVLCVDMNVKKYTSIRQEILNQLEQKKISNYKIAKFKNLLPVKINSSSKSFEKIVKQFSTKMSVLICTFLFELIRSVENDKSSAFRNEETWKNLDFYNNYNE